MTSVSIIIVTFNSEKFIEKCLKSITENIPKDIFVNVIVIDNDSKDSTVEIIEKSNRSEKIRLISIKQNLGFAKAINIGFKKAKKSDYYLLLNPDTLVNKKSISELITCSNLFNAGIVGGETVNDHKEVSGCYFRFPNIFIGIFDFTNLRKIDHKDRWHNYFYYKDKLIKKKCFPVDVVTGGYMLIRNDVLKANGYLDERFFMYLEDVDYCLRARKNSIKVYHSKMAYVYHYGGGSSDNKDRIRHRSWLLSRKLYFIKNHNIFINFVVQPLFLIDDLLIIAIRLLK